ncbi:hypothetical protein, partial [Belnapia arida]|uniref:hypothetical protein n=1 Tax=Belnapia arida TaxID=2804533 RepID=UPI001F2B3003
CCSPSSTPPRLLSLSKVSVKSGQAQPADGLLLLDSTTCEAHRAANGAVGSSATAEALMAQAASCG